MLKAHFVLAGCAIWAALHMCGLPIIRFMLAQSGDADLVSKGADRLALLSPESVTHLRKLVRAQRYCGVAAALGPALISGCRTLDDLLFRYSPLHEFCFHVALTHWLTSIVEDALTPNTFRLPPPQQKVSLFSLYILHHVMAVLAFGVCGRTEAMTALCAIGLCFEAPVIPVNWRELLCCFDDMRWYEAWGGRRAGAGCWRLALWLVLPFRFGGVALCARVSNPSGTRCRPVCTMRGVAAGTSTRCCTGGRGWRRCPRCQGRRTTAVRSFSRGCRSCGRATSGT